MLGEPALARIGPEGDLLELSLAERAWRTVHHFFADLIPTFMHASRNPFFLCHQGDWESVGIELDKERPEVHQPSAVVFFQHGKKHWAAWPSDRNETHVTVYSARGSHATLPRPYPRGVTRTDDWDYCTPGLQWRTWEEDVIDVHSCDWYGYGGAWGAAGTNSDLTGPLGPSPWKREIRGASLQELRPSEAGTSEAQLEFG